MSHLILRNEKQEPTVSIDLSTGVVEVHKPEQMGEAAAAFWDAIQTMWYAQVQAGGPSHFTDFIVEGASDYGALIFRPGDGGSGGNGGNVNVYLGSLNRANGEGPLHQRPGDADHARELLWENIKKVDGYLERFENPEKDVELCHDIHTDRLAALFWREAFTNLGHFRHKAVEVATEQDSTNPDLIHFRLKTKRRYHFRLWIGSAAAP